MFLKYIKDFIVKKTFKNNLENTIAIFSDNRIQKVGLLIDKTNFSETKSLVKDLISNGFLSENIKIIMYCDTINKTDIETYPTFGSSAISWNGKIVDPVVSEFINEKTDLLISFYEVERAILLQITKQSKAEFKVGFATIDQRLNHFMINTTLTDYDIFVKELFKYLKLLNKI